ncbi:hypothetical protein K437DRAFT_255322 [Tilletiaria anomala UBC 951]|uniref:ATP phosphoribosyltransferase n=1 Tax=Tilletiaria anomala (strain ATCC 24038 / CBS 436.72 / UBC 951) TaxID=1037660 RepID=A0A066W9G3_TILAU|nr:uncharacterized protein K437DRAFT_255322 [Tilletiaria anomala UBC 951]KDN49198.1 hypothetical protein K437DRAFT_255322 [Tilletiaria anomala UBC 951]
MSSRQKMSTSSEAKMGVMAIVTTPTSEEAEKLPNLLLEKDLVACAQLVPQIRSL